jgi:glycosyltransferase involved in cell wall biosynthesis
MSATELGVKLTILLEPTHRSTSPLMPGQPDDTRPGLMVVSNSVTPYRVNLHRLIAAGIPELRLHTLITHGVGDFDWQVNLPPEIHASNVSALGEHPLDNPLRRPFVEVRKGRSLIRYLRENNARAVILNGYRYISYLRLMAYCSRHGIPFFVRSDSNIRNEPVLSPLQRFVKRSIYAWWMKRAAGVLSMGKLGDEFFIKYGAQPRQIYRVPYWPDFDAFAKVDGDRLQRFRRRFGLDEQHRYIMFSGRLVRNKRVDLLIDAFAQMAHERPEWDLLIVGDGVLGDELRRRVPEGLRSRVVWAGFVDGDDAATAYHAADVLVLPSDREPWALVVQEAMSAGQVVIASHIVGAAHELVEDKVSGRIFTAGNIAELRAAILDVTDASAIDQYRERANESLIAYRRATQPVNEIRRALRDAGVLSS